MGSHKGFPQGVRRYLKTCWKEIFDHFGPIEIISSQFYWRLFWQAWKPSNNQNGLYQRAGLHDNIPADLQPKWQKVHQSPATQPRCISGVQFLLHCCSVWFKPQAIEAEFSTVPYTFVFLTSGCKTWAAHWSKHLFWMHYIYLVTIR